MEDEQFGFTADAIMRSLRNADDHAPAGTPDAASIGSLIVAVTMGVQLFEGLLRRIQTIEAAALAAAEALVRVSRNGSNGDANPV